MMPSCHHYVHYFCTRFDRFFTICTLGIEVWGKGSALTLAHTEYVDDSKDWFTQHRFFTLYSVTYRLPKRSWLECRVPGYLVELVATLNMKRPCPGDMYVSIRIRPEINKMVLCELKSLDPGKLALSSSYGSHVGFWQQKFLLEPSVLGERI